MDVVTGQVIDTGYQHHRQAAERTHDHSSMGQQRALWADEVSDRIQTHGKEAELRNNLLTRRGTEYHIIAKSERTK